MATVPRRMAREVKGEGGELANHPSPVRELDKRREVDCLFLFLYRLGDCSAPWLSIASVV